MRDPGAKLGTVLALALLGGACGYPEQRVVDQYFGALNARDNQTLGSFAVVQLETKDKRVDKWTINQSSPETRVPAPLVDLVKKRKDVETELAAHNKSWAAYKLEHYPELEKTRDLLKANAKIPASLAPVAAEYERVNQNDRELKKALSEAKDAVEKEKRIVRLSIGASDDLEDLTGDLVTKQLDLTFTIGGETRNYLMTLKKYEMTKGQGGPKLMSRWVVYDLKPKA